MSATINKAVEQSYNHAKSPKPGRTKAELNYRTLSKLFPEVASGEYRYLKLEAGEGGGMMPLHLEWIGQDEISVSHTFVQNGDLMRDPEMTFRVDREKGTLEPLTFQQDGGLPIYQEVYPEPGKRVPKLRNDLNAFAQQWFKNISEQGYLKREAIIERDGEDVRLDFDQDGNVLPPAPDAPEEPAAAWAVSPVTLYWEALDMVDREISRDGLGFTLREHTVSYDKARENVADELLSYLLFVADGHPDMIAAYDTLPKFREWLIEDILERNYRGAAIDAPDGPERHAHDPDAPEGARGAPPVPKAEYVTWRAKGPIKRPAQEAPAVKRSEAARDVGNTPAPPVSETVPEPIGAKASQQQGPSPRDPLTPAYQVGDTVYIDGKALVIAEVRESRVLLQDPQHDDPIYESIGKESLIQRLSKD
ncbi:MAG: hypothetical protein K2K53_13285, partial [Oscillospiraceae bacterium]|nr:hypothetical protein [Oscillospiraceae bacterium]